MLRRTGKIRAGSVLLLALLAAGAWLWWRQIQPQPTVEMLLGALPEEQAIVAYVDVPALRRAPHLGPWAADKLAAQGDVLPLAAGVRGLSLALGQDSVYLVGSLDLTDAGALSYLAQRRAGCSQPLDQAVCASPSAAGGYLSMRLLADNLLAVAHSTDPTAADRMAGPRSARLEQIQRARAAIDGGALVWIDLDPARLDALMRNPPPGWINLSLLARALGPAQRAALLIRESRDGLLLTLTAECSDEAGAAELSAVLNALNKMAGGLLTAGVAKADGDRWRGVLDSLDVTASGRSVTAAWSAPARILEQL